MRIIFCNDPLGPNRPDTAYEDEVQAAQAVGLEYGLIDFEKLTKGDVAGAVRRIKQSATPELAIYRGWMLRPEDYEKLYNVLKELGTVLFNTPAAYKHCHYLPESFQAIEAYTPATVWLPLPECLDINRVFEAVAAFGDKPLLLKDYVKSRKHEWEQACYIPAASDRAALERVVKKFLELQGDELNGGLVFREFVSLQGIGRHSKSGMPLTKEYRLFFLDGDVLHASRYWAEGDYDDEAPPMELFQSVAQNVQSRFFTMDVAQRTDGTWIIVELGDGQVAGLPDQVEANQFYRALANRSGIGIQ